MSHQKFQLIVQFLNKTISENIKSEKYFSQVLIELSIVINFSLIPVLELFKTYFLKLCSHILCLYLQVFLVF